MSPRRSSARTQLSHLNDTQSATSARLPSQDVRRESVRRSVEYYVRKLVFDGKLRPGDRVPQDEVAAALGVSNTPVREALLALEHEGLLTIILHRGAFVNAFDADSLEAQYELYAVLFSWAIRRALNRGDPDGLAELASISRQVRKESDPEEMYVLLSRFTALLQSLAGSRDWGRLIRTLAMMVPGPDFYRIPGALPAANQSFGAVADAIQKYDGDKAAAAVERWNQRNGEALIAELRSRQMVGT
jgi:DNA-binding GntR family transcriptional regulator